MRDGVCNRVFCLMGSLMAGVWVSTAAGQAFDERTQIIPIDIGAGDRFAFSVTIDGDLVVMGAPGYDLSDFEVDVGAVYVYNAKTASLVRKIIPDDGARWDGFGIDVDVQGTRVVVGSYLDDDNGDSSGSVYVFDVDTGEQLWKLLPDEGAEGDRFGGSVAISGDYVLVGASRDAQNGREAGAAYVFDLRDGSQARKLLPLDPEVEDLFGWDVALEGRTALVSAIYDDNESGSVYVFDIITGEQLDKLVPTDGAANDLFGYSIAIEGSTALVGAYNDDDLGINSGSAYLIDLETDTWIRLNASDGESNDVFGITVDLDDGRAVVGATGDQDNGLNAGAVYAFDAHTGEQVAKILPFCAEQGELFGGSLGLSGGQFIVGAWFNGMMGPGAGAAYLFDVRAPTCVADFNGDGVVNTLDIIAFIDAWNAGCE